MQTPKLLLVGGSGALFGMRAELIEQKLDYPAVNLGTHAALGIGYMLHLARQAAKPGDTVLLSFEYGPYRFGTVRRDALYIDYLLARDPGYFRALPLSSKFQFAMSITMNRLRKGVVNRFRPERRQTHPLYDASNLNAHGDQLANDTVNLRRKPPQFYAPDPVLNAGFTNTPPAFEAIEEFVRWAHASGVRVLATYPNIMDHPAYHTDVARKTVREIYNRYQELQVPVVGNFEESMMPSSAFYDTIYHLTSEGARIRTERLIPHLAPHLKR